LKVVSVNIGQRTTIVYNGKEEQTGIFKFAVKSPIFLGKQGVSTDQVVDRRYHGGEDKACYAYSWQAYHYWQYKFPEVEMPLGMFGENLTINGLDETTLYIGQVFRVGRAIIQVSQPRIPCYKLGIRFGDKRMVKLFQQSDFSGIYFRVIQEGMVAVGDELILQTDSPTQNITVAQVYSLFKGREADVFLVQKALAEETLSESIKVDIRRKLGR